MKQSLYFCILILFSLSVLYAEPNQDLLDSASKGDLDGVKKAISAKAKINFKDSNGTSALMFAANYNHFPVVRYLVDNHADILAKNTSGWTAAIMAGARGNDLIKEYLEGEEKKISKSRASGVVLHLAGEAYVENRKLRVGDIINENQTIYVAKRSVCDLQVKQSLSEFTLRLKELTVFSLQYKDSKDEGIFGGLLKQGTALFKIRKSPGSSDEKIQTVTPTVVASVRGTAYEVTVDKDKNTKISLYEGVARTRIRATEIEEDPSIADSPQVKSLISNLENNGQNVAVGSSIDITTQKQKKILEKANADSIRKSALSNESPEETVPKLSLLCSDKPSIKKINPDELKRKQAEVKELVGVDPSLLKTLDESEISNLMEERDNQ